VSLRARLLIGLIALAAVGLAVVGVVTYTEQRSFLLKRVDQQTAAAYTQVSVALDGKGIIVPGGRETANGGAGFGPGHPSPRGGEPGRRPGPGGPPGLVLPPGTYGARRDASGHVVGHIEFSYGQSAAAAPNLNAAIPISSLARPRLVTVGSVGHSGGQYRVFAMATGDQPGTTIVAVPLHDVNQSLGQLLQVEALVGGGVLLALALLAWLLIRLGLAPLARMGKTAEAIAGGELSRRVSPANSRTEVGKLGLALNSMLAQIEEAFADRTASEDRLRRFIADASHELRTPLASIRGYAELFRIGAARSDAEIDKGMSRIEDEATRMGALVEDLLTLARLDQLPELERKPVDLSTLARDAADDARAIAPRRKIELDAAEPVTVLGDSGRLRQVVGNLVRNALVHTPPDTPIELRVRGNGDESTLEVRDHGPGLPDGSPDIVFERFWRAERGRERGKAGAGLGLAIVAGIVAAHGGHVQAANAPGGGASFVIRLPAAGA
jgi:two-component system OmpR family sensor kinase